MTPDEYVRILRERSALSFIEDSRITLLEVEGVLNGLRFEDPDETPRQRAVKIDDARCQVVRLMLRIQDGNTP